MADIAKKKILAVDTNLSVHRRQTAAWAHYGIDCDRVDSIWNAIERLAAGESFLFIAINEDTVPDFLPQLRLMRDITDIPIYVITSHYTVERKIKALNGGADSYEAFADYSQAHVLSALEMLGVQDRWARRSGAQKAPVVVCCDIRLFPARRSAFAGDSELRLCKKEFDVLYILMSGRGKIVTHEELLEKVWNADCEEKDIDVLWRTVNRLRAKLLKVSPETEYIKIERGVGYWFLC